MRHTIHTERFYRDRYQTIKRRIMRNGFALRMMRYVSKHPTSTAEDLHFERELAEELCSVLSDLGPTFVKFGQLLSTHRELLPPVFTTALESLQDNVDPFPVKEARAIFFSSFGMPIDRAFTHFEPVPIASGSIAQVHKAVYQNRPICIKIQRPNIDQEIIADIHILKRLVKVLKRISNISKNLDFEAVIDEFGLMMTRELDFDLEADHLRTFANFHHTDKYIRVPEVIDTFSSKHILTMTFIDAPSLKEVYSDQSLDHNLIARRLLYSYSNQVFRDGFFHADPHPGNILVHDESHIYLVDFGIIGTISPKLKHHLLQLFFGVTLSSTRIITDAFYGMGIVDPSRVPINQLEQAVEKVLDKYLNLALHQIKIEDIFDDTTRILRSFDIVIPSELTLLGKTFITLEGIILTLDSSSNILQLATPIARKLVLRFISPQFIKHDFLEALFDTAEIGRELPSVILNALRKISSDDFVISLKKDTITRISDKIYEQNRALSQAFLGLCFVMAAIMLGGAIQGVWSITAYRLGMVVIMIILILIIWIQYRNWRGKA